MGKKTKSKREESNALSLLAKLSKPKMGERNWEEMLPRRIKREGKSPLSHKLFYNPKCWEGKEHKADNGGNTPK